MSHQPTQALRYRRQPASLKVKSMSATSAATLRKALPKACGRPASVGMPTWQPAQEWVAGFCNGYYHIIIVKLLLITITKKYCNYIV